MIFTITLNLCNFELKITRKKKFKPSRHNARQRQNQMATKRQLRRSRQNQYWKKRKRSVMSRVMRTMFNKITKLIWKAWKIYLARVVVTRTMITIKQKVQMFLVTVFHYSLHSFHPIYLPVRRSLMIVSFESVSKALK